jgi:hypothetical protein
MVRSAGRSRLRGANLPPKAGGLGHQGSPAAAPLEKVWAGVDRQSEDLGDDCQGCWRSSLTTLPSLTVEAGPILDLAIDQSVAYAHRALRRSHHHTQPGTPPAHGGRVVYPPDALIHLTPHTTIRFASADDIRAYVRDYLLPIITCSVHHH